MLIFHLNNIHLYNHLLLKQWHMYFLQLHYINHK